MTLVIQQEHIDRARNAEGLLICSKCPVWQAAEAAGITGIYNVTPHWIHFGGCRKSIDLPPAVARWIVRFDAGRPVEPITFEVVLT